MSASTNRALVVALVVVVGLFVLFGGGAMTGGRMNGGMGMTGAAWMGGLGWIWIPAVLIVGLGALIVFGIFGKKE
jgi:hypothetical protein